MSEPTSAAPPDRQSGPASEGGKGPGSAIRRSLLEESLSADEAIVERLALHWFARVPMFLWIFVGFLTLGLAWWLALYEYLRLKVLEQGVTNRRVVLAQGIVNRRMDGMELRSIERVEIHQGMLGRQLGFAALRIVARDGAGLVLRDVVDPVDVQRRLERLVRAAA